VGERVWHLARAQHHLDAHDHLRTKSAFPDWAAVALFYSALHLVDAALAGETALVKDERHPRKHSAPGTPGNNGRGRNQLVAAVFSVISADYRSLFEMSHRTRYDVAQLEPGGTDRLREQHRRVDQFVRMRIMTQPPPPDGPPAERLT
jgi:hypothetical protein